MNIKNRIEHMKQRNEFFHDEDIEVGIRSLEGLNNLMNAVRAGADVITVPGGYGVEVISTQKVSEIVEKIIRVVEEVGEQDE